MKSEEQSIPVQKECDMCQQTMNPTVHIYMQYHRLCRSCFQDMEEMPEVVAKSVERFISGNVV